MVHLCVFVWHYSFVERQPRVEDRGWRKGHNGRDSALCVVKKIILTLLLEKVVGILVYEVLLLAGLGEVGV